MSAPFYGRPEAYMVDLEEQFAPLDLSVNEGGRAADLIDDIRVAMACVEQRLAGPNADLALWVHVLEGMMAAFVVGEESEDSPF